MQYRPFAISVIVLKRNLFSRKEGPVHSVTSHRTQYGCLLVRMPRITSSPVTDVAICKQLVCSAGRGKGRLLDKLNAPYMFNDLNLR